MLAQKNFTKSYINGLWEKTGADPSVLERTVFAFGLLEAIRSTGLPFIFKGGTSLLLLLNEPQRLSTDIDIIVEPGTDVDNYIQRAGTIFPFLSVEEHVRKSNNGISVFTSCRLGSSKNLPFSWILYLNITHIKQLQRSLFKAAYLSMKAKLFLSPFLTKTVFWVTN